VREIDFAEYAGKGCVDIAAVAAEDAAHVATLEALEAEVEREEAVNGGNPLAIAKLVEMGDAAVEWALRADAAAAGWLQVDLEDTAPGTVRYFAATVQAPDGKPAHLCRRAKVKLVTSPFVSNAAAAAAECPTHGDDGTGGEGSQLYLRLLYDSLHPTPPTVSDSDAAITFNFTVWTVAGSESPHIQTDETDTCVHVDRHFGTVEEPEVAGDKAKLSYPWACAWAWDTRQPENRHVNDDTRTYTDSDVQAAGYLLVGDNGCAASVFRNDRLTAVRPDGTTRIIAGGR
jgi:hypothetical protein